MQIIVEVVSQFFNFLNFAIQIYNIVFLIWIISTWLPFDRSIFIFQFVDMLINPVYNTLIRIFPPLRIGIMDMSPFYMFIFLTLLDFSVLILREITLTILIKIMGS